MSSATCEAQKLSPRQQHTYFKKLYQKAWDDSITKVSYVFEKLPAHKGKLAVAAKNNIFFAEPDKLNIFCNDDDTTQLIKMGYKYTSVANNVYQIKINNDLLNERAVLQKIFGFKKVIFCYYAYTSACVSFNDPQVWPQGIRQNWLSDVRWLSAGITIAPTHDIDSVQSWKNMHIASTVANPTIVVNIVDGGFDVTNPEFQNRVIWKFNHTNNTPNTTATNHGTSVASLAVATANNGYGGVGMYDGPIRSFQISSDGITIFTTNGYKALDSLISLCQQYPSQRQITNFSFGSGDDPIFYSKLQILYNFGNRKINFFQAATGNSGSSVIAWPALWPECTAWGATNSTRDKPIWPSSNRGVDMIDHGYVNDGQNVYAMQANGSFAAVNGTSFAAPLGTGTVTNLVAQDTSRSNDDVRAILDEGALDLGTLGPDSTYGKGWAQTGRSLTVAVLHHMPNVFDASLTNSFLLVPKYYNGVKTSNEKLFINNSISSLVPSYNLDSQAVFLLTFTNNNGFVNGIDSIRYEFTTLDGCVTKISKIFTLSNVLSSTIYTFNGNGNWSIASNWLGNSIPPTTVSGSIEIVISPSSGGECVLDVNQTVSNGAKLTVQTGKQFRVTGNLNLHQ